MSEQLSGQPDYEKVPSLTLSCLDATALVEILQKHAALTQEGIQSLSLDSQMVREFPEYALALRAHAEIDISRCYRILRILSDYQEQCRRAGLNP